VSISGGGFLACVASASEKESFNFESEPAEFLTHALSSVTMSRLSISRTERLFNFLKPDNVGGSLANGDFLVALVRTTGFGKGGGGIFDWGRRKIEDGGGILKRG
jgi:hypothetical protein